MSWAAGRTFPRPVDREAPLEAQPAALPAVPLVLAALPVDHPGARLEALLAALHAAMATTTAMVTGSGVRPVEIS
jgi:hypothetical protein